MEGEWRRKVNPFFRDELSACEHLRVFVCSKDEKFQKGNGSERIQRIFFRQFPITMVLQSKELSIAVSLAVDPWDSWEQNLVFKSYFGHWVSKNFSFFDPFPFALFEDSFVEFFSSVWKKTFIFFKTILWWVCLATANKIFFWISGPAVCGNSCRVLVFRFCVCVYLPFCFLLSGFRGLNRTPSPKKESNKVYFLANVWLALGPRSGSSIACLSCRLRRVNSMRNKALAASFLFRETKEEKCKKQFSQVFAVKEFSISRLFKVTEEFFLILFSSFLIDFRDSRFPQKILLYKSLGFFPRENILKFCFV